MVIGSLILDHLINGEPAAIQTSVSAYYYTGMRNELEGIIFGIGMFLLCYHGYDRQDSIISKLAGLFGLCIALFPTSPSSVKDDVVSKIRPHLKRSTQVTEQHARKTIAVTSDV